MIIIVLFALLVTVNVIDAFETYQALSGSGFKEVNPIGRFLFERLGLIGGIASFKVVMLVWVGLVSFLAPFAYGVALNVPLLGWGLFAVIHNYRAMNQ